MRAFPSIGVCVHIHRFREGSPTSITHADCHQPPEAEQLAALGTDGTKLPPRHTVRSAGVPRRTCRHHGHHPDLPGAVVHDPAIGYLRVLPLLVTPQSQSLAVRMFTPIRRAASRRAKRRAAAGRIPPGSDASGRGRRPRSRSPGPRRGSAPLPASGSVRPPGAPPARGASARPAITWRDPWPGRCRSVGRRCRTAPFSPPAPPPRSSTRTVTIFCTITLPTAVLSRLITLTMCRPLTVADHQHQRSADTGRFSAHPAPGPAG